VRRGEAGFKFEVNFKQKSREHRAVDCSEFPVERAADDPQHQAEKNVRARSGQIFSEFVATLGLLCVLWGCSRLHSGVVPFAVAAYVTAAYWLTSSTSFANPAVTIARSRSDTFAGIRPADVPLFVAAQLAGALAATLLFR
jgi:glycerol uptake facilitator-like aquaporin